MRVLESKNESSNNVRKLNENFCHVVRFITINVNSHDLVLVHSFFGKAPSKKLIQFTKENDNIDWIEDRTCSFDGGDKCWGDYVLYNPTNIAGYVDGGIIVSNNEQKIFPSLVNVPIAALTSNFSFIEESFWSFEDENRQFVARWDHLCNNRNDEVLIIPASISKFGKWQLDNVLVDELRKKRKDNYEYLSTTLEQFSIESYIDKTCESESEFELSYQNYTPFCFPIMVKNREALMLYMLKQKILPLYNSNNNRNWNLVSKIPSNISNNNFGKLINEHLICLPCDHRYSSNDMQRITNAVLSASTPLTVEEL